MKANVLLATQEKQFRDRLQAEVGAFCHVELSASPERIYDLMMRKSFDVVIVDAKLPDVDDLALVHALRHVREHAPVVLTLGRLHPLVYLAQFKTWEPVAAPRSIDPAIELLRARFDPQAARSVQDVRYQPKEDTFFVAFRNGKTYELPRQGIEADDGTRVVAKPRVIHGGEAFEVRLASGKTYEVAWDFVLYHQEPAYPYHKRRAEQQRAESDRAHRIAGRIRQEREARRWSLSDLAQRTGIHPPNLSRLESGKHVPSLETLERVAEALGVRVADLLAM